MDDDSRAYRRVAAGMFIGSLVTFALLYSPQTLIHAFAAEFRVAPSASGLTLSVATMSLAFSMMIVSLYTGRYERKNLMTISLLAASALNVPIALSSDFQALLVLRAVQGAALGGFPAVAMTYISETLAPEKLGRAMGIYVSGSVIGAFAGRLAVSALTDAWAWKQALFALGVACLICCAVFIACLPARSGSGFEARLPAPSARASDLIRCLSEPRLLALYVIGFIYLGVYAALYNFIGFPLSKPPYALSQTMVGFLFVYQAAGCWSSYVFGKLTERYARPKLLGWSIVMTLTGAILTLTPHLAAVSLGLLLFSSGFLAGHSVASGWVGAISRSGSRGHASAFYLLFYYAGASVIGWLGGVILGIVGWPGIIAMICALLAVAGRATVRLGRLPMNME